MVLMDGTDDSLLPIGELARRAGLTVTAVRFYADRGIVPPAGRSPAGYRLYRADAVARLALVRTLRELDVDLATVRRVLARELTVPELAAAHAEALDAQIRVLRLRRTVLRAVAREESSVEEMERMHQQARLSEDERQRVVDEFLAATIGEPGTPPFFEGVARSMTPVPPADPSPEQLSAWTELTGLLNDPAFRTGVREVMAGFAAQAVPGSPPRDPFAAVREKAQAALTAGITPDSPEAAPYLTAVLDAYAKRQPGPPDLAPHAAREHLRAQLTYAEHPSRNRYLRLLATVNGWPRPEPTPPALAWTLHALTTHRPRSREVGPR